MISCPSICDELPPDAEISRRVKSTLHNCQQPALSKVSVSSEDGAIVLSGILPSYYLKQIAQTLAFGVEGVRSLDNQVEVVRN